MMFLFSKTEMMTLEGTRIRNRTVGGDIKEKKNPLSNWTKTARNNKRTRVFDGFAPPTLNRFVHTAQTPDNIL